MEGEQQEIKKAVENAGAEAAPNQTEIIKQVLGKAKKGATPKDALGLTDAMVEGIYGQAYRLYNTGKYKEAGQIFRLLIMINTTEPKYAMGLAACFHMLKDYQRAANTYGVVAVLDPESPISFYHTSDCFIQMGDPASALIVLETAVQKCGEKPEYKVLKDRAQMTIESLKKELVKAHILKEPTEST